MKLFNIGVIFPHLNEFYLDAQGNFYSDKKKNMRQLKISFTQASPRVFIGGKHLNYNKFLHRIMTSTQWKDWTERQNQHHTEEINHTMKEAYIITRFKNGNLSIEHKNIIFGDSVVEKHVENLCQSTPGEPFTYWKAVSSVTKPQVNVCKYCKRPL